MWSQIQNSVSPMWPGLKVIRAADTRQCFSMQCKRSRGNQKDTFKVSIRWLNFMFRFLRYIGLHVCEGSMFWKQYLEMMPTSSVLFLMSGWRDLPYTFKSYNLKWFLPKLSISQEVLRNWPFSLSSERSLWHLPMSSDTFLKPPNKNFSSIMTLIIWQVHGRINILPHTQFILSPKP